MLRRLIAHHVSSIYPHSLNLSQASDSCCHSWSVSIRRDSIAVLRLLSRSAFRCRSEQSRDRAGLLNGCSLSRTPRAAETGSSVVVAVTVGTALVWAGIVVLVAVVVGRIAVNGRAFGVVATARKAPRITAHGRPRRNILWAASGIAGISQATDVFDVQLTVLSCSNVKGNVTSTQCTNVECSDDVRARAKP